MVRNRQFRAVALAVLMVAVFGLIDFAMAAGPISAVGVENQYADIIQQVGAGFVRVSSIENNPNTDPHSFEVSPRVAGEIAGADLIVRNGAGYDDWVAKIIAAAPNPSRQVIDVRKLLALPDNLPNPHLWYDPKTMPATAAAIATALSALQPAHAAVFHANARKFDAALKPWFAALAKLKATAAGASVAVTEPVGDDLLQAASVTIATPFSLQAAIMNGTDPAPQDVTTETNLLAGRRVSALVYNQQVTDPLTSSFLAIAHQHGVPVVGVYETMPVGYAYQTWMLAETQALLLAFTKHVSTEQLAPPGSHE